MKKIFTFYFLNSQKFYESNEPDMLTEDINAFNKMYDADILVKLSTGKKCVDSVINFARSTRYVELENLHSFEMSVN